MRILSLGSASGQRWSFRDADSKSWLAADVPGCVHTDLLAQGKIEDPYYATRELTVQWIEERNWVYRTHFTVPAELLAEERLELVADGLDTIATVTVNGVEIGRTDNMFVGYRWDLRAHLRRGKNELTVHFHSAMNYVRTHYTDLEQGELNDPLGLAPAIRKQQCQFGWDWGPRLVTAGIWRDLRIEAWSGPRLESVRVRQHHHKDHVRIELTPELASARRAKRVSCTGRIQRDGVVVARIEDGTARIDRPELWWPNGHGAQPLYDLEVDVVADGVALPTWRRRIGLRTLTLDRSADAEGEAFQFVVNGRPIFAKGASWIPAHSFVNTVDRERCARDLRAAVSVHMNMIRVWGGGTYESEHFYDLCDELGLLVWQDFMFACALYPGDAAFVRNVEREAEQQIRRLRHRACLALWCGNNEIEHLNEARLRKPKRRREYDAVFTRALPKKVREIDGVTAYWQSSPHRPSQDGSAGDCSHQAGERGGDTHFWEVWHSRKPVKEYERYRPRFCSEFGMQSYSSAETNATFCPPDDRNVFGASMENHQKNRGGNQVILDYVSRRYRLPRSQDDLLYLSQLNQAYCMQIGVEHYRRLMPHCMGALYWQLNDCWPVASWSSIEFTGRWRALHHVARRFFAPALVSAHVPGDDVAGPGNYRKNDVREVHLYTVSDMTTQARGRLRWELFHVQSGQPVLRGDKEVRLRYGESKRQHTLDLAATIAKHGHDNLVLRIALEIDGQRVSEDSVFLAPPRFVPLPKARTKVTMRAARDAFELTFVSDVFQHRFAFELPGISHTSSDNYFELYPDEPKTVRVTAAKGTRLADLRAALSTRSLVDTYVP